MSIITLVYAHSVMVSSMEFEICKQSSNPCYHSLLYKYCWKKYESIPSLSSYGLKAHTIQTGKRIRSSQLTMVDYVFDSGQ